MSKQDIMSMIDDCMARQEQLSEWEVNFIDDIAAKFENKGELSHKQEAKLESIWDRVIR